MAFKVKALEVAPTLTKGEKSEEYPLFEIDSTSVAGTEEEVTAETAHYVRPLKYAVVVAPEKVDEGGDHEKEGLNALPEGLIIPTEGTADDDKVVLSGTPTVTGEFEVIVTVKDAGDRIPTATTDGEKNYVIIKIKIEERTVAEEIVNLFSPAEGSPEWKSITLGTTGTLQQIASAASKASELLDTNVKIAQATLKAAGVFLTGLLQPYILLLRLLADTIDDFVKDFKNIGFYVLEVVPSGKEVLPKDAEGNPITMILDAPYVAAKAVEAAAVGQTVAFTDWALRELGEIDIYRTGPTKEGYEVTVGKGKGGEGSLEKRDGVAEYDDTLGMYKMTPSQTIATMIAAFDDPGDSRRPQFSDSLEAGAIVIIAGFSDFSKKLETIHDALKAILLFFGGEPDEKKNQPGGVLTAVEKLVTLMGASLGFMQDGTKNEVKLTVSGVCGVRGTEENKIALNNANIPYNFVKEDGAKTPHKFELNDFVVGPRIKLGFHCMGFVSKIEEDDITEENIPTNSKGTSITQKLVVQGITNMDKICFSKLGNGAKLQKVAYKQSWSVHVDENSGETIKKGPNNSYEYISNLGTGKNYTGGTTAYNQEYLDRYSGSTVTVPKEAIYRRTRQNDDPTYGTSSQIPEDMLSEATSNYELQQTEDETVSLQYALYHPDLYGDINNLPSGSSLVVDQKNKDGLETVGSINGTAALTKVTRKDGKSKWEVLLTPGTPQDVTETFSSSAPTPFSFTTLNNVVGNIRVQAPPEGGTHPDFKAVKMEDLIEDWATFFMAIDALTDALRKMADDAAKALQDIIDYLDGKIAELERINKALQAILKLFTTGLGDAGIYVLNIPTEPGGINRIKSQLQSAPNRPPDTLDFSMGFLLMSGGPQADGFKVIQKLLIGEE